MFFIECDRSLFSIKKKRSTGSIRRPDGTTFLHAWVAHSLLHRLCAFASNERWRMHCRYISTAASYWTELSRTRGAMIELSHQRAFRMTALWTETFSSILLTHLQNILFQFDRFSDLLDMSIYSRQGRINLLLPLNETNGRAHVWRGVLDDLASCAL